MFFCLFSGLVNGQLISQKKVFSRADSLRGSLRPERTCYDVQFYDISIAVDTGTRRITGAVDITFNALTDITTLQIDLSDSFTISSLTCEERELPYTREGNAVFVAFMNKIPKHSTAVLHVQYSGRPVAARRAPWDGGFVWERDSNGYQWIGVACEGLGASSWWPCKDHNSDEPDKGVLMKYTVPASLMAVGNGAFRGAKKNNDGTATYTWQVSYPINLYDVTLNVGDYVHFSDTYRNADGSTVPLNYYVLSYHLEQAKVQFKQVKPMMQCYEKFLGKYPFARDGYKLVESPYLGMEHQSAIAYGNRYRTGYNGIDFSRIGLTFDYIIIHETGHEWWGNSVSCNDMADMWLHESFCTYTESIYVECLFGKEKALAYINAKKGQIDNAAPIQGPYRGVNEEGDGDMYSKGSLMLNTIRSIVNDDAKWWPLMKSICDTAFRMKTTDAEAVVNYMAERTHLPLVPVFHQYLNHAAIPELHYSLTRVKGKQFNFRYYWKVDEAGFEMPVIYQLNGKAIRLNGSTTPQNVSVKLKKESEFSINEELTYFRLKKE